MIYNDVEIRLGSTCSLGGIVLLPKSIQLEDINVSGNKPVIDPSSTEYGGILRSGDFKNLPLDRDYKNMISLLPF